MKTTYLILVLILFGCKGKNQAGDTTDTTVPVIITDTTAPPVLDSGTDTIDTTAIINDSQQPKKYSNEAFKEVSVQRTGGHTFQIKGKARVFEATFSWVVEDGHNEIKRGSVMTDAGAPAWGNFTFKIDVVKQRKNSTLTLILFEASAKDGSRRHQLPIKLY